MTAYLIKRLILILPTLLGVTIVVFAAVRFLPGNVVDQMLGPDASFVNPETREALMRRYSLDQNGAVQYLNWAQDLIRGDFGRSILSGRPVMQDLSERLPVTFQLGLMGLVLSLIIALPIGIVSAIRQDTWIDHVARSSAIVFLATPGFWIALLAIIYGFMLFNWSPPLRYTQLWQDPAANLRTLWVPALILGLQTSGGVMRLTRGTMLEVLRQDYVRTGWAKGLSERQVVVRHALRNAIIPVITVVGLEVRGLVGGTVILETVFSLPGMGSFLLSSIQQRDYPVVQAIVLITAVVVIVSNLVVDLTYSVVDPRIRYG